MAVSDGQRVNAEITNAAYISRTQDSNAIGKIDLENSESQSIIDIQSEINKARTVMFTEQVVMEDGEVNSLTDTSQFRTVKSASGLETASTTPFGNKAFRDGIEITLMGTSSEDTLRIVPSDEVGGCAMNGPITLTRFATITFKWIDELQRFVELRRNGL